MGDRELLTSRLKEFLLEQPFPAGATSVSIDDNYGFEVQEDGGIKIIAIVDGEPQEIGWRNPDGDFTWYDDGTGGVCIAEEDYVPSTSCENCFSSDDSDSLNNSAQRLAETPPQPKSDNVEKDKPTKTPKNDSNKSEKHSPPVFGSQTTHQPAPAVTPPVISVANTSHGAVVFLSPPDGSATVKQHVTAFVEAGVHVFGETTPAAFAVVTDSDSREPVATDRSDAVDGAVLCFAWAPVQDSPAREDASDASSAVAAFGDPKSSSCLQDQASHLSMGVFSGQPVSVDTREDDPFYVSDESFIQGGEFFAACDDGASVRDGPAVGFLSECAWVEGETIPTFIGWPFLTARSESTGFQGIMTAVVESAKQSVTKVNDQNPTQDHGKQDGNSGEDGDNPDQDGQNRQHNPQDEEEKSAFA